MANDCTAEIQHSYPEGSFQRLLGEEQIKASSVVNARARRWHPVFIKWCLYLRHLSGKAYELVCDSGCVQLPSQRTLRDYTHHISTTIGLSVQVDEMLLDIANLEEDVNRYVFLIMDEVHIKQDLVFDKHFKTLLGFVNIGDFNTHLSQYEASVSGESGEPVLAKSMLVLMVRGLFWNLNFPYAQFACTDLTGDLLVDPIWEAIARLERQGFIVMGITCDGASVNRRFWKIHAKNDKNLYKIPNIFSSDGRFLYFISDPPHLLKTTRNCCLTRNLCVRYIAL